MTILEKLKEIGLNTSEIKVFMYLLEHGESTPPQISKGTKIARPNCYKVLRALKEKHLVQEHKTGRSKAYLANDPLALVQMQEMKTQIIKEMLPDLRTLYTTKKNKPKIRFYEGFDQVKQIWIMSLEAKDIKGMTSTKELYKNSPAFFDNYHKQLKKKGIILRDILTPDSAGEATDWTVKEMGKLYEVRILPNNYETLPTDILIWDDNVALINITDPVVATVLTDKAMADTFRIFFDLTWRQLS